MDGYSLSIDPGEHQIGSLRVLLRSRIDLPPGSRVILSARDVEAGQTISRWLAGLAGLPRPTFVTNADVVPKWVGLAGSGRLAVRIGGTAINDVNLRQEDCLRRARLAAYVFPEPLQYILGRTVGDEWRYAFAALDAAVKPPSLLELYGLGELVNRATLHLSGGEAHRLNIACAVESGAPLVVMDLSAQNLDRGFLSHLPTLLDQRCATRTVVIFGIQVGKLGYEGFSTLSLRSSGELVHCDGQSDSAARELRRSVPMHPTLRPRRLLGPLCKGQNVSRPGITAPLEFDIQKGQVYRLVGPNGSGKTTIGKILAGRLPRSDWAGSLVFNAQVSDPPVIMTSQYPRRSLISIFEGTKDSNAVSHAHSKLKLAAARWACSFGADLVFLDEPTAGVTREDQFELIQLINERDKTAFILATHDDSLSNVGQEICLRKAQWS